jgi:SWI/SNF-related matrix-associated actin-dependent regulator of chromatin subfamily A3
MTAHREQVQIVGSSFHPGAGNWIARMGLGQPLILEREPDNQYDKNAVAVKIFHQKLGYLARGFAVKIAPLMDSGITVTAKKSNAFPGTGVIDVSWEAPDG